MKRLLLVVLMLLFSSAIRADNCKYACDSAHVACLGACAQRPKADWHSCSTSCDYIHDLCKKDCR